MNQLTAMLEAHPNGLRKAEIARRLGVHRSTVGRYVDQLSLTLPVWERDSRIGLESIAAQNLNPDLDVDEGMFVLFLLKLYEKEINIKNPHASSLIRKLSGQFRNTAPVLCEELLQKAESLELVEKRYLSGFNETLEKMTEAWLSDSILEINYLHKATGESCRCRYKPQEFFVSRMRGRGMNVAVSGLCMRSGEICSLYLSDFFDVELLSANHPGTADESFCPVSEFAREHRPDNSEHFDDTHYMKEANHRIKNNLFMTSGLVDIAFAGNEDPEITETVRGLQSRIDAIAEIHEQLSMTDGSNYISLEDYLTKLITNQIKALAPEPEAVKTRLKINDVQLDAVKVVPLGMIVSELVTNSFKHAMKTPASCISLNVTKFNGIISLRYGDGESKNGISGMDGRTGLKLINGFCGQLGCKITYKNKHILLEFPA